MRYIINIEKPPLPPPSPPMRIIGCPEHDGEDKYQKMLDEYHKYLEDYHKEAKKVYPEYYI